MSTGMKALLTATLLSLGPIASAQVTAYGAAARINGVEISNATLEKNFEEYQRENDVNLSNIRYPDRVKVMRREVLDGLIEQELVWQVVQEKGQYASDEDVQRSLEQIRGQFDSEDKYKTKIAIEGFTPESYQDHVRRMVSASLYLGQVSDQATVTLDEIHEFYVANPDKFVVPESLHAKHILLIVHPNANEETRAPIRERMNAIIAELEGSADFAVLAAKYSEDGSKASGGDLGYIYRGQMVGPFEDAAFATDVGEVSGIIETVYGLHLIKVEDRQPEQTVPEDMAREQIYDYMLEQKRQQMIRDEISALRADAKIEVLIPL